MIEYSAKLNGLKHNFWRVQTYGVMHCMIGGKFFLSGVKAELIFIKFFHPLDESLFLPAAYFQFFSVG